MSLRAAFMGSPQFAVPYLRAVHRRCDLRVVVCQPDRPAGRGRKITPPPVKDASLELGLPVLQPTKMKDGTLAAALREHDLEVIVVVAFGRILPKDILELPVHGCVNVHGSVLPRWRGAAPIQRAILAGDEQTGVSIMKMDEGMDTGPVYSISRTPIEPHETSGELFERLSEFGAAALDDFLQAFPQVPPPKAQDDAEATHAPPLQKAEGRIDFARPARVVADHIRGMDPWPSATTTRAGQPLKLFRPRVDPDETRAPPGTVLGVTEGGLRVACLGSVVCVGEVQPAGKRRMAAGAYAAGRPFVEAETLGG